jgi:glycosyltransferase involved in cell wall biosynthesis
VGNIRGSKNVSGLLKAYLSFRQTVKDPPELVLVGKNLLPEYEAGFPAYVRALGVVETADLPPLYSGAVAFIFPSLYEGFGLPPLEAMACGTPVLSSYRASLPEVCDEAALYFDPLSMDSMVRAMTGVVGSDEQRKKMSAMGLVQSKKFSWSNFVDQTWQVYEDVYQSKLSNQNKEEVLV